MFKQGCATMFLMTHPEKYQNFLTYQKIYSSFDLKLRGFNWKILLHDNLVP